MYILLSSWGLRRFHLGFQRCTPKLQWNVNLIYFFKCFLITKLFSLDTAENESSRVCQKVVRQSDSGLERTYCRVLNRHFFGGLFQTFGGSFSAVWTATIARVGAFFSIFWDLPEILGKLVVFRIDFDEILPEFHEISRNIDTDAKRFKKSDFKRFGSLNCFKF